MSTRKLTRFFVIPIANSEKTANFRNLPSDNVSAFSKAFKSEGKLVPHFIRNGLIIGILHHVTDFDDSRAFIHIVNINTAVGNASLYISGRSELLFQKLQERGFSTSRFTAQKNKITAFNLEVNIIKGTSLCAVVCKIQIFDFK